MQKRHRLHRSKLALPYRTLEQLESRVLLSTTLTAREVFDVDNIPDTAPTSTVLSDTKSGPMADTSQDLINLYLDYRRFRNAGGLDANYHAPASSKLETSGSKVAINVRGRGTVAELTDLLRSLGSQILYRNGSFVSFDTVLPITQLHTLAANPGVATINGIYQTAVNQAGSANNQADEAELADVVRNTFGVDGTGLKIGILSDSVNIVGNGIAGSVATGDLPADGIQVISDSSPLLFGGNDEGRAIAELIHDIAPGAELAFATAEGGQQVFANNIRALRAAGCDIIVDDVGYFAEPFFQPGVIDQAISDVVASGGIYVSSAGNDANDAFETGLQYTTSAGVKYVDWDAGPGVDTLLHLTSNPGGTYYIQWDNPYNGIAGNVSTDLDILAYNHFNHHLVASATTNNLRTGVPLEVITLPAGELDLQVRVAGNISGTPLPTRFKMYVVGVESSNALTTEYPGLQGTVNGHSGGVDTISVGAVPYSGAPPFSNPTTINSEDFSSVGPVTQIFDANGNRLATPATLQKPDISGIDGGNTSFFTGSPTTPLPLQGDDTFDPDILPNFFGTSAAAPDVAAVIALIKQAAPDATQAEILDALKSTATPLNGATAGQYDLQGGFGLVNAFAAIEHFVQAPTVQIKPVATPVVGSLSQMTIVFDQQVTGVDAADVILSFEGGTNLLTGGNSPTTSDGGRTWIIPDLTSITSTPGHYNLTVANNDGNIVNTVGTPMDSSASLDFTVIAVPSIPTPPTSVALKVIDSATIRVRWVDASTSVSGYLLQRAEDPAFSTKLKNVTINSNTTVYTDSDTTIAGKTLYYRVRAFNVFNQNSTFSAAASISVSSPGEVIVDNDSVTGVQINGTWQALSGTPGFYGTSYLDDLNSGKGTNSVRFTPNLTADGDYFVYVRWVQASNNATNVPIDVISAGGKKTVVVNQRTTGGGWVLLGKFSFKKGAGESVLIRTNGTNGHVIADAVRFLSSTPLS